MSPCFHFLSFLIYFQRFHTFPDPGFDKETNKTAVPRVTTRVLLGIPRKLFGGLSKVSCRKFDEFIVLECS